MYGWYRPSNGKLLRELPVRQPLELGRYDTSQRHLYRPSLIWYNIKIPGELSHGIFQGFSHKITRPVNGKSVGDFLGTIVNVRIDRGPGIGHVVYRGRRDMTSQLKRRFQFLLLVLEAKTSTALYLS
jgi:hypothetical protein